MFQILRCQCDMISAWPRMSLSRGRKKGWGPSAGPAERISRCLSTPPICCSCVVSRAHFLSIQTRRAALRLLSITPKHVVSATLTDTSLAQVVLNFPRWSFAQTQDEDWWKIYNSGRQRTKNVCVNVNQMSPDLWCFGIRGGKAVFWCWSAFLSYALCGQNAKNSSS